MDQAMKRRNIKLGSSTRGLANFINVKDKMRQKFPEVDEAALETFTQWIVDSGHTQEDLQSIVMQADNAHRPAVAAFLHGHEHVLDQLHLTQGTYTHFNDTAADPNFALRHPGNAELMYRRITPGDLIMMQAAHINTCMNAGNDLPAEAVHDYWRQLWLSMKQVLLGPEHPSLNEAPRAAGTAYNFCIWAGVPHDDLHVTFFMQTSRFYVGTHIETERVRVDDEYQDQTLVRTEPQSNEAECMFMTACVLTCYGIDHMARRSVEHGFELQQRRPLHTFYSTYVQRKGVAIVKNRDLPNANQETQEHTGPYS